MKGVRRRCEMGEEKRTEEGEAVKTEGAVWRRVGEKGRRKEELREGVRE